MNIKQIIEAALPALRNRYEYNVVISKEEYLPEEIVVQIIDTKTNKPVECKELSVSGEVMKGWTKTIGVVLKPSQDINHIKNDFKWSRKVFK